MGPLQRVPPAAHQAPSPSMTASAVWHCTHLEETFAYSDGRVFVSIHNSPDMQSRNAAVNLI